jgi:hypothetical protein
LGLLPLTARKHIAQRVTHTQRRILLRATEEDARFVCMLAIVVGVKKIGNHEIILRED